MHLYLFACRRFSPVLPGRENGEITLPYLYDFDFIGNFGASQVNRTWPSKWMRTSAGGFLLQVHC